MTGIAALPQKIVDRKIVVLKSRLDVNQARLLGDKVKGKFFARLRFLKPKAEDIQLISVDEYYEPYIVIGGKYAVDYCKRRIYALKVHETMQEVVITRKKFKPQPLSSEKPLKVIKLEGEGHFHYENETYFILDRMGCEVAPAQLPFAPSEEQDQHESAEDRIKVEKVGISREEEVDFLQSKIVKRPPGVEFTKEIFEVNERTLVCCPMYRLTFQNIKTERTMTLKIDAITGRITPAKPKAKYMKDYFEIHTRNLPSLEARKTKGEPEFKSPPAEVKMNSRTKIAGEIFFVGEDVTAAVGDAAIPSGTIMVQNIVVRGLLKVGADCRIYGNLEALRDIVIGSNTTIEGNVISGGRVVIGSDSIICGSVKSGGTVEIADSAVIEGGLYSESSVALDQVVRVSQKENAEIHNSALKSVDDD